MIRKNAVESVQAERNILISARNPFVVRAYTHCLLKSCAFLLDFFSAYFAEKLTVGVVGFQVRFFYSFTCRDNLYLVMEYLNGGDMYSMLRNLGCLEESMARVYVAELVICPLLDCYSIIAKVCVGLASMINSVYNISIIHF